MKSINRFKQYRDESFDRIMLLIKNGTIKAGRYAHLVKIDKKFKVTGKELFSDERRSGD